MKRSITSGMILAALLLVVPVGVGTEWLVAAALPGQASGVKIQQLEATVFFPRQPAGQPLKQRAILHLDNPGAPVDAVATITVGNNGPYQEDIGTVTTGESAIPIPILDIAEPSKVIVAVRDRYSGAVLDTQEWNWQPQKKWKIFSVSYSHHDLGFGNYPHRSAHRNSSRQHRAPAGVLPPNRLLG